MDDKTSRKHDSGNVSRVTKPTLAFVLNTDDSHSLASSNAYGANSMTPIGSLSGDSQKPNFEGIRLVWYHPHENMGEHTKRTKEKLREINPDLAVYSNQNACVNDIRSHENEKVFLIISEKVTTSILQEIHQLKQVDSIFIVCNKVEKYQHLSQKYDLIFGIYCERDILIDAIKQNVELLQQQRSVVLNFYKEHDNATRDISKESAEFLWFQLFKDVLLQISSNKQAKQEMLDFCRQYCRGNQEEYKNISEFEHSYESNKSVTWYTKETFLYKVVNRALRTEDIGQLQIFRFFIRDLSSSLAELQKKQSWPRKYTVVVYRGSKMKVNELKRLKQNVGGIISTNGFLSTSSSKTFAISFTGPTKEKNMIPVLYEIECNSNASKSIVFADITELNVYKEEEILFDIGSTFKIESISKNEQLKMDVVKLIATDDGMIIAQKYIELNKKMNEETTPDIIFGTLLIQMGKYDQSLIYFTNLLNTSEGNVDVARIHCAMGSAHLCKGELDEAYEFSHRAYKKMIRTKHSRIKDSTRPMTVMAHIYLRREMFEKALDFYFEVLKIHKDFRGRKHLNTAVALNDIGNVYYKMKSYSKSLSFYENSFEIRKAQLPYVHLDIAASLNNLGLVYWKTEKMDEAVKCFQESLNIRKQLLPSDHNDIIQSLDNLTRLFYENHDIENSLKYFTEALNIQKIKFDPDDHDDLLRRLNKKFGLLRSPRLWPAYAQKCCLNSTCRERIEDDFDKRGSAIVTEKDKIELQKKDLSILKDFIKTLDDDADYGEALKAVRRILTVTHEISLSNYDHTEYLITSLRDLVMNAYDSTDESNKAFRFYQKMQYILENEIAHIIYTADMKAICLERIEGRKKRDRSILESFIKILDNDGDYDKALKVVKDILMAFPEPFISGYNHTEYLIKYLGDLVTNAYDSTDESKKAFHFYEKLQYILKNEIPHSVDTNDVQIICLERLGHIHQINNNYESAVVSFEQSRKIQRDHEKISDDIPDKLRNIGLLHMTLGNHTLALASFEEALEAMCSKGRVRIQHYASPHNRDERMILMRIDETQAILKSTNES